MRDAIVLASKSAAWNSFKLASIIVTPSSIFIFIGYGVRASLFVAAVVYGVWVGAAMLVSAVATALNSSGRHKAN